MFLTYLDADKRVEYVTVTLINVINIRNNRPSLIITFGKSDKNWGIHHFYWLLFAALFGNSNKILSRYSYNWKHN